MSEDMTGVWGELSSGAHAAVEPKAEHFLQACSTVSFAHGRSMRKNVYDANQSFKLPISVGY